MIEKQTICRRCGTCCRNGGPALHVEDRILVMEGSIPLNRLFTIRQHEPAYDNVAETVLPAATDILKIKSDSAGSSVCSYYHSSEKACGIYPHRPLECRILNCREPEISAARYQLDRLTREHLLSGIEGLWELVQDHHQHCDYRQVAALAAEIRRADATAQALTQVMEIIRYDFFIRQGLRERSPLAQDMLDFLFGRSLALTIGMFQLKLAHKNSEIIVLPFVE
jgi:Fe-S-cluster containining protein